MCYRFSFMVVRLAFAVYGAGLFGWLLLRTDSVLTVFKLLTSLGERLAQRDILLFMSININVEDNYRISLYLL
jgi:hypothetical protein